MCNCFSNIHPLFLLSFGVLPKWSFLTRSNNIQTAHIVFMIVREKKMSLKNYADPKLPNFILLDDRIELFCIYSPGIKMAIDSLLKLLRNLHVYITESYRQCLGYHELRLLLFLIVEKKQKLFFFLTEQMCDNKCGIIPKGFTVWDEPTVIRFTVGMNNIQERLRWVQSSAKAALSMSPPISIQSFVVNLRTLPENFIQISAQTFELCC